MVDIDKILINFIFQKHKKQREKGVKDISCGFVFCFQHVFS